MIKVFINPGHAPGGNPDPGAVGPSGLREADVVAEVAAQVADYLNGAGCEAISYQSDSLQDICNQANGWGADLIVSIHCNSFTSAAATGMEIWTSRGQTRADRLATLIMSQMAGEFPTLPVRGDWSDGDVDKEAGLYVLINTSAPAVLVELAFISNPNEEAILGSVEGKRMFAAAIARGVTDHIVKVGA
jgi:N-acetylmuramoyl-L-alanine amidase